MCCLFSALRTFACHAMVTNPTAMSIRSFSLTARCLRRKTDDRAAGAPDLVIEILSPSTASRTAFKKRALYERHGVREFLDRRPVEPHCYSLPSWHRQNVRQSAEIYADTDKIRVSIVENLEINLEEIFPSMLRRQRAQPASAEIRIMAGTAKRERLTIDLTSEEQRWHTALSISRLYLVCRFTQKPSDKLRRNLDRQRPVTRLCARKPCTISLMHVPGTPIAMARRSCEIPIGFAKFFKQNFAQWNRALPF